MKWNVIYVVLLILISNMTPIKAQGIQFEEGTWEAVKAKAKKLNKPIFVDAYTTWCAPCQRMIKNIFPKRQVGEFVNEHFLSYKMDVENNAAGPDFQKQFQVNAFPTLIFLSPSGEVWHRQTGGEDIDFFLKTCAIALDTTKRLSSSRQRYEAGERDKKFLRNYINQLRRGGLKSEQEFKAYWDQLNEKERLTRSTLVLMSGATDRFADYNNEYTQYFLNNLTAYDTLIAKDHFLDFKNSAYIYRVGHLADMKDEEAVKTANKELLHFFPERRKEFPKRLELFREEFKDEPDSLALAKLQKAYLKVAVDRRALDKAAYQAFIDSNAVKKDWRIGLKYAKRSYKIVPAQWNTHLQAYYYYRLERYKKAKKMIDEAIDVHKDCMRRIGFDEKVPDDLKRLKEDIQIQLSSRA